MVQVDAFLIAVATHHMLELKPCTATLNMQINMPLPPSNEINQEWFLGSKGFVASKPGWVAPSGEQRCG